MKTAIRADASPEIGFGHVWRCATLANGLRKAGVDVRFVCREHDGHLCDQIQNQGFSVARLPRSRLDPAPRGEGREGDYVSWLGADWSVDATETIEALRAWGPVDWLVVDHYAVDRRWETALRTSARRIMVIDDLANRPHDCDLLLDQNLTAGMHTRYEDRVPAGTGLLLGPEYALLQPLYAELHAQLPARDGLIRRIFVFFGGVDSDNLTGRTLAAILGLNRPDIEVDVVVSASGPHVAAVRRQASGHSNVHFHSGLPTLAPLMAGADLAVGAGGATSWERLCLRLPALVVTLAENQRPVAEELDRRGLIRWLGNKDAVSELAIAEAVGDVLQNGWDKERLPSHFPIVDGKGASRVCAALTVTATTTLRVRHAGLEDEALLLELANDPETRRNAFAPHAISEDTHRSWFSARVSDPESCYLYVVETEEGVPVGQVRFDRAEQAWRIDYALVPHFRGRGLGRPLLESAMRTLNEERPRSSVFGQVKDTNIASMKVFESLGFDSHPNGPGTVEYRRALSDE